MKQPIKMTPGDELHLTALMAPFSLNLVTGQDRQHLLGYGRAAFEAGKAGQCLHQIQEPAPVQAAPAAVAVPAKLSGGAIDTLVALIERGPLEDGDVPSKAGRNELLGQGLAAKVIVNGNDGWQAATYKGRDAYKAHFGTSLGGAADTIREARSNRIAKNAIRTASSQKDTNE